MLLLIAACAEDRADAAAASEPAEVDDRITAPLRPAPPHDGSALEGVAAAKLVGESAYGSLQGLAGAGDVDGDGVDDVIVGAGTAWSHGGSAGVAYVVRGPPSGTVDLGRADARLLGDDAENAGAAVAAAGDVNGDGFGDLLVGAPYHDGGDSSWVEGRAYLVFGRIGGDNDLRDASVSFLGPEGPSPSPFECWPWYWSFTGQSLAGAGDVDGDGFDDVLIAANGYGYTYLVHGPMIGEVDLVADVADVLRNTSAGIGVSVQSAGDTDGDGLPDVLVGSSASDFATLYAGGSFSGSVTSAEATTTFQGGSTTSSGFGAVLAHGDLDGDGYVDLLTSDPGYSREAGEYGGIVYFLAGPFGATVALEGAAAQVFGPAGEGAGVSVLVPGDLDADGQDDLVVGATGDDDAGVVYVVAGPLSGVVELVEFPSWHGAEGDQLGLVTAAAGDVNADGVADLLVGAPGDSGGGPSAGAAWLILGGP